MSDRVSNGYRRWLWSGIVGAAASLVLTVAVAQPAPKASATPAAAARPLASAAPKATGTAPAGSAASTAAPAPSAPPPSARPHDDDDEDTAPAESPHGHMGGGQGAQNHGGMGFEPPPDGSEADPALPPGTISISVRNAEDIPLAGVDVVLGILHNSVAKGESRERKEIVTDDSGTATISGLQFGGGHTYRVSSSVGPGVFDVQPFSLTDKAGMRVVLHLYEVTEDVSRLRVAMRSSLSVSLKEDVMVVDVTYNIFNVSPSAWLADVEVPLPAGFKAFNTAEDMAMGSLKVLPTERGAVLRGTIPPGQSDVGFRYHLPLTGDEAQDVDFSVFPHTLQTQLAVEASKKMRLVAEGFPPAQLSHTQDGRSFLLTTRGFQAGPLDHFKATIGGLPTRGPGGWVAVGLAIVAVLSAAGYRLARAGKTDMPEDAYQDLIEARETLIDEIATLERAHLAGNIGPKSYARARMLLTEALARIMAQLDTAAVGRKAKTAGPRKGDGGGASPKAPNKTRKRRAAQASL